MDLPVSANRIKDWKEQHSRPFIQNAFPDLNADEREFLLTGINPKEWNNLMKED